jgi:hypothetical protein
VREGRGLTLEEAARDTRVRREYLEAIEAEEFHRLLGDVHVRGCLRTYATYLGLSPDKTVTAFEASYAVEEETPAPAPPRTRPVLGARRRRDDHRLWILVAVTVLVLAGAFGVLSARRSAPPPADLPAEADQVAQTTIRPGVSVAVLARRPVEVRIVADGGEPVVYALEAEEGRSFDAETSITIRLSEGASARVTVNGVDHGYPGVSDKPWKETYSYDLPSETEG